ncbi:hypothetical protein ACFL5O_11530 [Myxococcota bacterium]
MSRRVSLAPSGPNAQPRAQEPGRRRAHASDLVPGKQRGRLALLLAILWVAAACSEESNSPTQAGPDTSTGGGTVVELQTASGGRDPVGDFNPTGGASAAGSGAPAVQGTAAPGAPLQRVACNGTRACGIAADGGVQCWGGAKSPDFSMPPARYIAMNERDFACAIDANATLQCWDGIGPKAEKMDLPHGPYDAVDLISNLEIRLCAWNVGGSASCWTDQPEIKPLFPSAPGSGFSKIVVSRTSEQACGLREGRVECWGGGRFVQPVRFGQPG